MKELYEQSLQYLKSLYPAHFEDWKRITSWTPTKFEPEHAIGVVNLARLTGELSLLPTALLSLSFLAIAYGQQVGTLTTETHPKLSVQQCSAGGSCQTVQRSIVLDSNWRWLHNVGGSTNCYTGNTWDTSLCPDPETCASNCALDGADYSGQSFS